MRTRKFLIVVLVAALSVVAACRRSMTIEYDSHPARVKVTVMVSEDAKELFDGGSLAALPPQNFTVLDVDDSYSPPDRDVTQVTYAVTTDQGYYRRETFTMQYDPDLSSQVPRRLAQLYAYRPLDPDAFSTFVQDIDAHTTEYLSDVDVSTDINLDPLGDTSVSGPIGMRIRTETGRAVDLPTQRPRPIL